MNHLGTTCQIVKKLALISHTVSIKNCNFLSFIEKTLRIFLTMPTRRCRYYTFLIWHSSELFIRESSGSRSNLNSIHTGFPRIVEFIQRKSHSGKYSNFGKQQTNKQTKTKIKNQQQPNK